MMRRTGRAATSYLRTAAQWQLSPRFMASAAAPPPPPTQEAYLSASSSSYVEEMYEAWTRDPKSVHASWDAYFKGSAYQAPPSLGLTKPNEVPLASIVPALAGMGSGAVSSPGAIGTISPSIIEAHLAVQTIIRSYQVRGHLAAQIDPLGINNMTQEEARSLILRSMDMEMQEAHMDTVFQLPRTTWIGGKVKLALLSFVKLRFPEK